MPEGQHVAIIDYGMGNLFSVARACEIVGLRAAITTSHDVVLAADAAILPGVGAFGDAMERLRALDLVDVLREVAASGKPLMGICLGMQLLMTESHEFGRHQGLNIIGGEVVRLQPVSAVVQRLKVPQVGWNHIDRPSQPSWQGTLLEGLRDGEWMYFVHSFCAIPKDRGLIASTTQYGTVRFCSSVLRDNVFGCQFHPERSGPQGLRIYRNLAARLQHPVAEARR